MIERMQHILTIFCLWSLFATSLALVFVAFRPAFRAAVSEATGLWRKLTRMGRTVFVIFAFCMVLYGGGKTNSLPQKILAPLRTLVQEVQTLTDAEKMASNWNVRGVWVDSFCLDFEDGWVFPWGTDYLSSVEVISQGAVWPAWNDTNAVATIGVPVAIVPGLTEFSWEHTPSNTYRFAWANAAVGRNTNDLITASIELFRCGDVTVTTNGITTTIPRTLPFEPSEPQDKAWVDEQVGEGLANGLYKFTATFPDDPPEAIRLKVGDSSLAGTNAGVYAFLLEKGVEYEYGTIPFQTNVTYAAVDDVLSANPRLLAAAAWGEAGTRTWTVDGGYSDTPQTFAALGRMAWWPLFCGSPDVPHIGLGDGPVEFTAVLSDWCRTNDAVAFQWSASEGLTVASPNAQTTEVTVDEMPSWAEASIYVTATLGGHNLISSLEGLSYGTNDTPQVHLSLNLPDAVLLNSNETSATKIATVGWSFASDVPTSGVVTVSCVSGSSKVNAAGLVGTWNIGETSSIEATIEGIATSDTLGDVVFRAEFVSDGGTNAVVDSMTVIETKNVLVPAAPSSGLVVLTNTPVVLRLDCEPQGAGNLLSTMWHTRRLKSDDTYEAWDLVGANYSGASLAFTPWNGGIYQVRALASVAAGGTDERFYVWEDGDSYGLMNVGDNKSIGVCDTQWQINLRNMALSYLGVTDYAYDVELAGAYGFHEVDDESFKCNYFVAYRIRETGLPCPVQRRRYWRQYPPMANDWATETAIEGWIWLGRQVFPQPGYVIGHPNSAGSGHVGIVDFDGAAIAAGTETVNRKYDKWLDGTSGFNKLTTSP